jgi:hypothetical protein
MSRSDANPLHQPGYRGLGALTRTGELSRSLTSRNTCNKLIAPGVGAGSRLLSGGNPLIAVGDGDALVQAYVAAMTGSQADVGRRLDAAARCTPGKAIRWNAPFYGIEVLSRFLAFYWLAGYVKVAFLRGSSLDQLPVEAKDAHARYFHIHENDPFDEALLGRCIGQAAAQPGDAVF